MENFGEYITKEYGILKKILKYLNYRDLLTARKVCRDWCRVVNRIFLKEFGKIPEVFFSENNSSNKEEKEFWSNMKSIPEVLIKYHDNRDHNISETSTSVVKDMKKLWKPLFDCEIKDCVIRERRERNSNEEEDPLSFNISPTIIYVRSYGMFSYSSKVRDGPKILLHSDFFDDGGNSTVSLPRVPGVHYSVFTKSLKRYERMEFDIEELERNQDKGPVRCILLYIDYDEFNYESAFVRLMSYIVQTVEKQQKTQFAFGGGKVEALSYCKDNDLKIPVLCGIIIRGENIVAHSSILLEPCRGADINEFFESMAGDVGPLPDGASRLALMAQCVDRPKMLKRVNRFPEIDIECLEMLHFSNHFPNVPICGFLAGGEYGWEAASTTPNVNSKGKKSKLRTAQAMHCQSTSIVVLTYLNALT